MHRNSAVRLAERVAFALHEQRPMLRFALVALVLVTGCTRRQQDFAWFAANVAVAVAETTAAVSEQPAVAVAAPNPDSYPGPSQADLERARNVALELTTMAAADARKGNCDPVVRTANHVRVIDGEVFANVFLRDPAIQQCLAIAPQPPIARQ